MTEPSHIVTADTAKSRHIGRWIGAAVLFSVVGVSLFVILAKRTNERADLIVSVASLEQPAEILVDQWGVPHIYAGTFDDAFLAQGFNAARDRLFQIDLWRRRGLGQLAEVLGPAYVDQDKAARLFLYRGDMKREWASYGPDAERIATAFVRGINGYIDWLATRPREMPLEFRLLGYEPAKWTPADVVRIRSHGLTRNLRSEVARANTVCKTNARAGLQYDEVRVGLQPSWVTRVPEGLDPCLPEDVLDVFALATQDVQITPDVLKSEVRTSRRRANKQTGGEADQAPEGSNNWTIGPAKSATGRPILANDPHRAYSTPSLRYIVHLNAPGLNVVGAGEPALPGISIGHNGTIGFGLTIFAIDQEDLYVYELNRSNTREYRYQAAWEPMRVIRETIPVRNASSIDVDLVFTRHGPVVHLDGDRRRAYALRSCWLEPGMSPYFGSVGYMRATSFPEFQRAMLRWGAPTENLVYADVTGNIGWVAGGLAPIRPNWDGLMPVPGDGRYEWAGFWSGEQLPSSYNPAQGYITTSNEMNLPADYPNRERKLGFEWANRSRHTRIDEVLQSLAKVSIEDSLALQNDVVSLPARRLVAVLSSLNTDDATAKRALNLLRDWDGVERAESPQAALMEVWMSRHLDEAFRSAVLPPHAAAAFTSADVAIMLDALEKPAMRFVGDSEGSATEKRNTVLLESLRSAYLEMEKLHGADASKWQWGMLHHSLPEHALANVVDTERRSTLQPGPFPKGGSAFTPNASAYRANDFRQTNGPSFRMVLDVGNWDNSRAINYPGQSGNATSRHYSDLANAWLTGEYFPLLYTRAAVEGATETRIELRPAAR
jgi:penicillin amidase